LGKYTPFQAIYHCGAPPKGCAFFGGGQEVRFPEESGLHAGKSGFSIFQWCFSHLLLEFAVKIGLRAETAALCDLADGEVTGLRYALADVPCEKPERKWGQKENKQGKLCFFSCYEMYFVLVYMMRNLEVQE
jgi:hypothetical protein